MTDPLQKYKDRVYVNVHPEPNTGCWLWSGAHDKLSGYGTARFPLDDGRNVVQNVHRVVYEIERGKIPDGLDLDHTCRTPACVNPDHLEPVTRAVNLQRGIGAEVSRKRMMGNTLRRKWTL